MDSPLTPEPERDLVAAPAAFVPQDELAAFGDLGQAPLLPQREPLGARLAGLMARHQAMLLTVCVLILWAITTLPPLWVGDNIHPGQVAPHDFYAPHDAILLDRGATAARQNEAAALVTPEYERNPQALAEALTDLHAIIATARHTATLLPETPDSAVEGRRLALRMGAQDLAARRASFNTQLGEVLPQSLTDSLLSIPPPRLNTLERSVETAVRAIYSGGQIRSDVEDDILNARARMARMLRQPQAGSAPGASLNNAESEVATSLADHVAWRPNLVVDERETARDREKAQGEVPPVYERIEAGTVLVHATEKITDGKWSQLQEMDLVAPHVDPRTALARLVLCIILIGFSASYLSRFQSQLVTQPAALWLAAAVPLTFLAFFRCLLRVPHADNIMVPLAATAAMLLTVLLNSRVGILSGFLVASICAFMAHADITLFLVAVLSAWTGVLGVSEIASRFQLLRAACILALTTGVLAAAQGALRGVPNDEIVSMTIWGAVAGIFSVVATAGLAMLCERPFGITTHLRLLELLAPDEVVMRRMQAEAPGTYTHSLMVALLGEAAAKAVGADPLLCRVGGLYHDIGKLRRPHCFVENQSGDNVHDRLSPLLSARVIRAHVKDGVELGRALRLPRPVIDIIEQHHGVGLITYFHQKALRLEQKTSGVVAAQSEHALIPAPPDDSPFRYEGPRPQSKEAAIVLLADTVEASARSLSNLTLERLQNHIASMIGLRLREGELSECELTLRDLGTIERSFTHVLRGVLHHRIAYPGPAPVQEERGWARRALVDPFSAPEARLRPVDSAAAPTASPPRRWARRRVFGRGAPSSAHSTNGTASDAAEQSPSGEDKSTPAATTYNGSANGHGVPRHQDDPPSEVATRDSGRVEDSVFD